MWVCLLLGQNVITSSHNHLENRQCYFTVGRFGRNLGSTVNLLFICFYIYITHWIYLNFGSHLGVFFHGTDLNALGFELITVYIKTILILLFGRIGATDLVKCLNHLAKSYAILQKKSESDFVHSMITTTTPHGTYTPAWRSIKLLTWALVVVIIISSATYAGVYFYTIFWLTVPYVDELRKKIPPVRTYIRYP
jgi:hypothetical protein